MSWYGVRVFARTQDLETLEVELARCIPEGWEVRERDSGPTELLVYLQASGAEQALARAAGMLASLAPGSFELGDAQQVDEKLWVENWRGHFPPLPVGGTLLVVPPWHEAGPADGGRRLVRIHPGMAFGTGHHASTRACLVMLERLLRPGDRVADVGTGSGILAVAALLLGAASVEATDTDPIAVAAARDNARLNDVTQCLRVRERSGPPEPAAGTSGFDIVLANIFAETLAEMDKPLTSCVMNGGHLVLAGIGSKRLPLIQDHFRSPTWTPVLELREDPWVALALRKQTEGETA